MKKDDAIVKLPIIYHMIKGKEMTETKLPVCYHMIKGKESAETRIDLPIVCHKYRKLLTGIDTDGLPVIKDVLAILRKLTRLQGYDKLGSVKFELQKWEEEE
jgi:hypothetical protein